MQRGNLAKDTYWPRYSAQNGEAINTSGELTFNNYKIGFSRVLRLQGEYMTGIDVMHIQVKLANLGYSVDTDGIYGRGTAAIVRQFQSDRGMDADGICGQSTWNAITSAAGREAGGKNLNRTGRNLSFTNGRAVRYNHDNRRFRRFRNRREHT